MFSKQSLKSCFPVLQPKPKSIFKFRGEFIHSCVITPSPINVFLRSENVKWADINCAKLKAVQEYKHPSLAQACASTRGNRQGDYPPLRPETHTRPGSAGFHLCVFKALPGFISQAPALPQRHLNSAARIFSFKDHVLSWKGKTLPIIEIKLFLCLYSIPYLNPCKTEIIYQHP